MSIGVNRSVIFIDSIVSISTRRKNNRHEDCFEICHLRTGFGETKHKYLIEDTVIFYRNCSGEIRVYSSEYQAGANLGCFILRPHIEASFDMFKDARKAANDSIWMLQFMLDDPGLHVEMRDYLNLVFGAFTSETTAKDYANSIIADYHPDYLRMCLRKHCAEPAKNKPVDPTDFWPESLLPEELEYIKRDKRQLYRTMQNFVYGKAVTEEEFLNYIKYNEMPKEENMEKMVNFRKDLEYLRRDKKHPNEFNIKFKDESVIRKIIFQGATKKDLYSDALEENVLIIASRMMADHVAKVIFNLKNKMTIIFPWAYGLPEKVIVKANGLDAFDILNGYTIATAKMLCSEDGYEWLNKLKKGGKVDV